MQQHPWESVVAAIRESGRSVEDTAAILREASSEAENQVAAHFNGETCSMVNKDGQGECPICSFTLRFRSLADEKLRKPEGS